MKIKFLIFESRVDTDEYSFINPQDAIDFFNKRGYGMHNWNIFIQFEDNNHTSIELRMFNYITDNWNKLNSSEGV